MNKIRSASENLFDLFKIIRPRSVLMVKLDLKMRLYMTKTFAYSIQLRENVNLHMIIFEICFFTRW